MANNPLPAWESTGFERPILNVLAEADAYRPEEVCAAARAEILLTATPESRRILLTFLAELLEESP